VFDQLGEQNVGKPDSCWDNIVAESFFAALKKERVCRRSWPLPHLGNGDLRVHRDLLQPAAPALAAL
jgi:hypothetical protein